MRNSTREEGLPYLQELQGRQQALKGCPAMCTHLAPIPLTTCMDMHALGAKVISEWKREAV